MCDTTMEKQRNGTSYLRKIKKPLIEKKRRDRINSCLSELKVILLDTIKLHGGTQVSKLDKADILEMTVSHLRQIQHQQLSVAMATNASVAQQYQEGFVECAKETVRYMDSTRVYPSDMSARIERHLVHSAVQSPPMDVACPGHFPPGSTHSDSHRNIYQHAPVHVVIPVKREPVDDVTESSSQRSPDFHLLQMTREASVMKCKTESQSNNHKDDATHYPDTGKENQNTNNNVTETSKGQVLAIPARVPVNVSPSQKIVWRPF